MIRLSKELREKIAVDLGRLNDHTTIMACSPMSGGCIHNACRLETEKSFYMVKWSLHPLPGIFLVERQGLDLIRSTVTVRVPEVYAASESSGEKPAYLLMEWIDSPPGGQQDFDHGLLGRQFAALHQSAARSNPANRYGLDHDNYIGRIKQVNDWDESWIDFFCNNRLLPQIRLAADSHFLSKERLKRLDYLVDHLDQWLEGVTRQPSLLHGDLWQGNVIAARQAQPVLLDPAVYYGDREIDLAFTELFGGFQPIFYQAYQEAYPLADGYENRKAIYNLYHLINHLNHFGEAYGPPIDKALDRYVP